MRNIMMNLIAVTALSGLLTWVDARGCPELTKSNETSGYINYNQYQNSYCKWSLPQLSGEDYILVLELSRLSLMHDEYHLAYLKIPGIPRFSEIEINCLIFATIPSFDAKLENAAVKSLRSSCHEHTWILRGNLPEEINLSYKRRYQISFRIDYDYIRFGAIDITAPIISATTTSATTTSARNYSTSSDNGTETHSDCPTIHFGVFAALVSILAVLLILCVLTIVWMQRRLNKVTLTSNALRGSIRAATRIQASTLQRVEERPQPNELGEGNIGYNPPQAYAEIAGCSTAVQQSGPAEYPEAQYHQVSYVNQSGLSRRDDYENSTYAAVDNPESQQVSYVNQSGLPRRDDYGNFTYAAVDNPESQQVSYVNQSGLPRRDDYGNSTYAAVDNPGSQQVVVQQEIESDDQPSAQYAVLNKKPRVGQ